MSLIFFTVFMDDIIKECAPKLKKLHVGYTNIKAIKISEFVFADSIVITTGKKKT